MGSNSYDKFEAIFNKIVNLERKKKTERNTSIGPATVLGPGLQKLGKYTPSLGKAPSLVNLVAKGCIYFQLYTLGSGVGGIQDHGESLTWVVLVPLLSGLLSCTIPCFWGKALTFEHHFKRGSFLHPHQARTPRDLLAEWNSL